MTDTTTVRPDLIAVDRQRAVSAPLLALRAEIEHFLYVEATLLDDREYESWLELVDEDVRYYAPIVHNVPSTDLAMEWESDPLAIAWFDEGKVTLAQRVAQLRTGEHWIEEPISRTTHCVSNVLVERVGPTLDDIDVVQTRCNIVVHRSRQESERNAFVGKRRDVLRRDDRTGWKLLARTIYLDEAVLSAKTLSTFL